jgi:ABC-type branched-subunit amino acid transport system ATPase component
MIEVVSLSRNYGSTPAVDKVSFSIGANEVVGLLGHNGAGKTTIMRMLSGFLEPSAGSVTIAGADMASQAREVQKQLGYLPEHLPFYPEMLVADYLEYVATLKGIPPAERHLALREAIIEASCQRLRAVILTSATTIAGLTPLLFERSVQAQFLVPMAISIVFGLGVATVLVLLVIPALLRIYEERFDRGALVSVPAS